MILPKLVSAKGICQRQEDPFFSMAFSHLKATGHKQVELLYNFFCPSV